VAIEDAAAVLQLGLELVENHITHDPDRNSRRPDRARLAAQRQ
jgi:hypothetical protein